MKKRNKTLMPVILTFVLIFSQITTAFATENNEAQQLAEIQEVAEEQESVGETQGEETQNEAAEESTEESSDNMNSVNTEQDDIDKNEPLQESDSQSLSAEENSEESWTDEETQSVQPNDEPQDETETTDDISEDIMTLSAAGDLTEDVIRNELNGVIDDGTIVLDTYFEFTTDEVNSPASGDIKAQAASGDSISPGSVDGLFSEQITIENNTYFFDGISVGAVEVYYIGTIKIGDVIYVYYITDSVKTNTTVYTVLNVDNDLSDKFTVTYSLGNSYNISYVIQDSEENEQESIGDYDLDDVFGSNRTTRLNVTADTSVAQDSYTVSISIPRGYKATVSVYNADGTLAVDDSLDLGEMMVYKEDDDDGAVSGGVVNPDDDSPGYIQLTGTIPVNDVTSDQTVVLQYEKYKTFTFSTATWLTTANAGNGVSNGMSSRLRDISITVGIIQRMSSVRAMQRHHLIQAKQLYGHLPEEQPTRKHGF